MSDSGGIGSIVAEAIQAVAEPVKDEVGQDIEAGKQAIFGSPPAPADPAKKAAEEKQKADAKWVIEQNKRLDQELKAVRQKKAEEAQKNAQVAQQQEQVKQFKLVQKDQKSESIRRQVQEAKTRSETRKGVGG